MERVAEWLRRWARDQGVRGSIPAALVTCKNHGHAVNPHRLCPPSISGYQGERKLIFCERQQLQKTALHSPPWGNETVNV